MGLAVGRGGLCGGIPIEMGVRRGGGLSFLSSETPHRRPIVGLPSNFILSGIDTTAHRRSGIRSG